MDPGQLRLCKSNTGILKISFKFQEALVKRILKVDIHFFLEVMKLGSFTKLFGSKHLKTLGSMKKLLQVIEYLVMKMLGTTVISFKVFMSIAWLEVWVCREDLLQGWRWQVRCPCLLEAGVVFADASTTTGLHPHSHQCDHSRLPSTTQAGLLVSSQFSGKGTLERSPDLWWMTIFDKDVSSCSCQLDPAKC